MPHDPLFEQRILDVLTAEGAKAEPKKMFGGVAFMVKGHMSVGITNKGDFMARFDPARHAEVSGWPGAKPMTFGKGDMKGFLFVEPTSVGTKAALARWVRISLVYVSALPPKKATAKKKVMKKEPARKPSTKRASRKP
ncbi:MAG: TfoX/Sxy family protein [Flavobacteriales bacterium]|nr:TfoX/Sxy family protein [Flavobacteriales bacterium]